MTALRPVVTTALASAAAVVSACATPGEGPSQARVRIVFHPYAETLRMRIAELPQACLPPRQTVVASRFDLVPRARGELGLPHPPTGKSGFSEGFVTAGKLFVFASDFDPNGTPGRFRSCYVGTAFVPEAGADYELRVELVPGGCEHTVRQFGADGVPDIASPMSPILRSCP